MKKAILLFSGGQDSTTCLAQALQSGYQVTCLSFNYGQKHSIELEQSRIICDRFGVDLEVVDVRGLFENSALLQSSGQDVSDNHGTFKDLPASFVPGRNMIFLSIAAAKAVSRGIDVVITGVCETDYSGYPDCRQRFIDSMRNTINLATESNLVILTPLMYKSKAETWKMAKDLGILDVIVDLSHTDYNGDRSEKHDWGYGSLDNPATILRAKGYNEAKQKGWL
jgi:7-cyano-7-deazaguanine synthase